MLFDPHRPGHESTYHPGDTNMLMADIAIINKVDSASPENIEKVKESIQKHNPRAIIVTAESVVKPEMPDMIAGKRVMIIEDGPTLTHGEMAYGAGVLAARRFHAAEIVDPRPHLKGTLRKTFEKYPHIGALLPAMGYSRQQIRDLEETINQTDCDLVLAATPIDLSKIISIQKPVMRVRYEYGDTGSPTLEEILKEKLGE